MGFTVRELYERFPYPKISLLARMRRSDSFLLNYEASVSAAFGSTEFAVAKPRILVVGAGTFEPYVVALANPNAEIVAVDFSEAALKRLRRRLLLTGLSRRVKLLPLDLLKLNEEHGQFNMIVATGVLHHLAEPSRGLAVLERRLAPFGVLRAMLYSRHGRSLLYRIRSIRESAGIRDGFELKRLITSLPPQHPLRIYWELYSDTAHEGGRQDGFFVPEDHPFTALELRDFLRQQGLVVSKFLHAPTGSPGAFDELAISLGVAPKVSDIEKLSALDALGELESNFIFLAIRQSEVDYTKELEPPSFLRGNPVLQKHCPRELAVKLLGTKLKISRKLAAFLRDGMFEREAVASFGADAVERWENSLILVRERAHAST